MIECRRYGERDEIHESYEDQKNGEVLAQMKQMWRMMTAVCQQKKQTR